MKQLMPQECPILFIYLTWALYLAGLVYFPLRGEPLLMVGWLFAFPLALWGYIRAFPRLSQLLGYGRVSDVAATDTPQSKQVVTMYSSLACPFCPIVERRLRDLERKMGFEFRYVDVTLKPELVRGKNIRSVPVVEVGDQRLVGHATTQELAKLISGASG